MVRCITYFDVLRFISSLNFFYLYLAKNFSFWRCVCFAFWMVWKPSTDFVAYALSRSWALTSKRFQSQMSLLGSGLAQRIHCNLLLCFQNDLPLFIYSTVESSIFHSKIFSWQGLSSLNGYYRPLASESRTSPPSTTRDWPANPSKFTSDESYMIMRAWVKPWYKKMEFSVKSVGSR